MLIAPCVGTVLSQRDHFALFKPSILRAIFWSLYLDDSALSSDFIRIVLSGNKVVHAIEEVVDAMGTCCTLIHFNISDCIISSAAAMLSLCAILELQWLRIWWRWSTALGSHRLVVASWCSSVFEFRA